MSIYESWVLSLYERPVRVVCLKKVRTFSFHVRTRSERAQWVAAGAADETRRRRRRQFTDFKNSLGEIKSIKNTPEISELLAAIEAVVRVDSVTA